MEISCWRWWHPTLVLLPGKSHGRRSLEGCSPLGSRRVGHDWATLLSRIREGNGNPLQCSCLENPRDGGAWCAAIYGVAQSWTRLKRLSSSSRDIFKIGICTYYVFHCLYWMTIQESYLYLLKNPVSLFVKTKQNKTKPQDFSVVQWLRIHLPMQGTEVQSLVGKLRFHVLGSTNPAWSN